MKLYILNVSLEMLHFEFLAEEGTYRFSDKLRLFAWSFVKDYEDAIWRVPHMCVECRVGDMSFVKF